jgi:HAD superfamily phosphatase (TIGR01681 family)
LLIIIFPSVSESCSVQTREFLRAHELNMRRQLAGLAGVDVVRSEEIHQLYPVTDSLDPQTDEIAHIPYTPMYYSVLGTLIVRRLYRLYSPPCKVIMVDTDNSLWGGVCGEVGPQGIQIDTDFLKFQDFLVQQAKAGRLVCVVSRNSEEDVMSVFEQRAEMRLTLQQVSAICANWSNKSDNIRQLTRDLNIGLDSVVFLDDDPVVCAEVMANCPEVFTFQLPDSADQRMDYLHHLWALDNSQPTALARHRTGPDRAVSGPVPA